MDQIAPVVDLAFSLHGSTIPADHGYPLFAAISRHLPGIHGDEALGVHPIRGRLLGRRRLGLTRESRLVLRLPASRIREAIVLAGKRLDVAGMPLLVGVPATWPLLPAPSLTSRLVVIRGFMDAEPFLEAVRRQLGAQGIAGAAQLEHRQGPVPVEVGVGGRSAVLRRTVRIREREVVGFAVRVDDLRPAASLLLQAGGLGGRRRFGCGIFVPVSPGQPT